MRLKSIKVLSLALAILATLGLGSSLCRAAGDPNIAPNGKATASSSNDKYDDSHPNDPNAALAGKPFGGFNFQTNEEVNPWWMVEFDKDYDISSVKIYNREDCCSDRANTLQISYAPKNADDKAPDPAGQTGWTLLVKNVGKFGGVSPDNGQVKEGGPYNLMRSMKSVRYLKIQLSGKQFLHLDTVMIFGKPAANITMPDSDMLDGKFVQ